MGKKLIKYKSFGKEIVSNNKPCLECGKKNKRPIYKKIWFWIVIVSVIFGIMMILVAAGLFGGNIGDDRLRQPDYNGVVACSIEEYREKMNKALKESDFSSYTIGDFEEVNAKSEWDRRHLYKAKIADDIEVYLITDGNDKYSHIYQMRYRVNLISKNFKLLGFLYGTNLRLLYPQIDAKETEEVCVKKLGLGNIFAINNNKCNFYNSLLRAIVKDNNLTLYISESLEVYEKDYTKMEPLVEVNVVDMSTMTAVDIDKWAAENKIKISRENKYSDTVEKGKFISQSVKANEICYQGDYIFLTYSLGKEPTREQKKALEKAQSYCSQNMSKKRLYSQLTSQYENFSAVDAQYAADNVLADWNAHALAKAKTYQKSMSMSKQRIYEQLTSEFEQFTPAEAKYAIDNLGN